MKLFLLLFAFTLSAPLVAQITFAPDKYTSKDTTVVSILKTTADSTEWYQTEKTTIQGGRITVQVSEPMKRRDYVDALRSDLERLDQEVDYHQIYLQQLKATRARYKATLDALKEDR